MHVNQNRNDAGESIFFARELELMKAQVFERDYADILHARDIPLSPDKDPSALSVTYTMFDKLGIAKLVANYADDLPRVDIAGRQFSIPVHTIGASVGWNKYELAAGLKTGRPVDRTKLSAATEVMLRKADGLAYLGDADAQIVGLTNHPNVPNTVVPTVGGATTWAAKIALGTEVGARAVLNDLNAPFSRMLTVTRGREVPNAVLLPPSEYARIASTVMPGNNNNLTMLALFLASHPGVTVDHCHHLETSGTGGAKQMITYRRDPMKLQLEMPQDLEFEAPEQRGLETIVAATIRFAGVQVYKPLSLDYSYGM